jgi:hypothetical protein
MVSLDGSPSYSPVHRTERTGRKCELIQDGLNKARNARQNVFALLSHPGGRRFESGELHQTFVLQKRLFAKRWGALPSGGRGQERLRLPNPPSGAD